MKMVTRFVPTTYELTGRSHFSELKRLDLRISRASLAFFMDILAIPATISHLDMDDPIWAQLAPRAATVLVIVFLLSASSFIWFASYRRLLRKFNQFDEATRCGFLLMGSLLNGAAESLSVMRTRLSAIEDSIATNGNHLSDMRERLDAADMLPEARLNILESRLTTILEILVASRTGRV